MERKYRVAVIDDEPEILSYLEDILVESGHFETRVFCTAKQA